MSEHELMPCETPCVKCGSDDVHRRFYQAGQDTNQRIGPNTDQPSTEWVNRSMKWNQPALKDCIVHGCRCCGYKWDSDPFQATQPPAVTAWAVFGPDGEIYMFTLNKRKERSVALGKKMDHEFEELGYTCERVKITRLGKEGE